MHRIIAPLILIVAIGAALMTPGEPAVAQDAVLEKLYGTGVHAFYAGDYMKAHKYFTMAIDAGTKDPRPFYFRGLAYMRLGRAEEAELDFTQGANLEMADINQFYPVAASLARVQGGNRVMLEQRRTEARLANYEKALRERNIRFGNNPPGGGETVPAPLPTDPTDPAEGELFPEQPTEPNDGGAGIEDPFKNPNPTDPPAPVDPPVDPVDPGVPNPFEEPGGGEPTNPFDEPGPSEPTDPFNPGGQEPTEPNDPFANPGNPDPFGTEPEDPGTTPPVGPGIDNDPKLTDPGDIDAVGTAGTAGRAILRGLFGGGGDDTDAGGGNGARPVDPPVPSNPFEDDKEQPDPFGPEPVEPGGNDPFAPGPAQPGNDGPDPFGPEPVDPGGADPFAPQPPAEQPGDDGPDPFGPAPVNPPAGELDPFGAAPAGDPFG